MSKKKKVYVVLGGWGYERGDILGIFTNKDSAEKFLATVDVRDGWTSGYDFVRLKEHALVED